jgi:hypothetical protein
MDARSTNVFLAALAAGSSVSEAAAASGFSSSALYSRRKTDADFAEAWRLALEDSTDILEKEARRRAIDGVEEPIYQGGLLVGTKTVYSDSLLSLLLKGRRKDIFSERRELTGKDGADLPPAQIIIATGVPRAEQSLEDLV